MGRNESCGALELISLTVDAQLGKHCIGDYYLGNNEYNFDGASLQKYFDQFAYACGRK